MEMDLSIYDELTMLESPLAEISNKNLPAVPAGYFDLLPATVLQTVQDEIPLSRLHIKTNQPQLPPNYFSGLPDAIMDKIRNEGAAILSSDNLALSPGTNVFTRLAPDQQEKLHALPQGEHLSPLLSALQNTNVFTVPVTYFDQNPPAILEKLHNAPGLLRSIPPRRPMFRFAAAACIAAMLGLSLFMMLDNNNSAVHLAQASISKPKTAMPASSLIAAASEILNTNSFDSQMEMLDEADMISYLENSKVDVGAALVASLTDGDVLPNQEDYLANEETLNIFLNQQHIINGNN